MWMSCSGSNFGVKTVATSTVLKAIGPRSVSRCPALHTPFEILVEETPKLSKPEPGHPTSTHARRHLGAGSGGRVGWGSVKLPALRISRLTV